MTRAAANLAAATIACVAAACSPPLMRLPSGGATPVGRPDAAAALSEATTGCAGVRTLTAEMAVGGSAAGRRLRGRLLGAVAVPAAVRLEAVAPFGQPLFFFVAVGDEATLLLPRDDRVLERGRPDAVLEAVAGVPLGAADLRATLTGCVLSDVSPTADARQYGDEWMVIGGPDADELYLRRTPRSGPWQLVAATRHATSTGRQWRAEYTDRQGEVPRSIRLTSVDADSRIGRAFDLRIALSQVEINTPLDAEVFRVRIPATAAPITIEELRASGPLAPR